MRALTVPILLLLAGCVSPPEATLPDDLQDGFPLLDPVPEGDGHDHMDPAQHAFATPNVYLLAFHALGDNATRPIGHYGEIDTVKVDGRTLAVVAVTGIDGEMPGFVVLDTTDPRAPVVLSNTSSPLTGRLADVKFHPSGKWLVAAAQSGTQPKQPGTFLTDPANVPFYASQNGLRIYDVSDPAAPVLVQQEPSRTGYGCHMVTLAHLAGRDWIYCIGRTVEVWEFTDGRIAWRSDLAPQSADGVANIPANEPKSNPQALATEVRLSVTPHDATFQLDPMDGTTPLLVVSWWDLGVHVYSLAEPTRPMEVGAWAGEGASRFEGNVHTALLQKVGDRRVLFAIPELLSDNPPAVWVVDFTDWSAPAYVSEWASPGEHGADGIRLSTHNINIVGTRLYMAYYHAGVWVLDVSEPEALRALGYYLPHSDVPPTVPRERAYAPNVWDVLVRDGAIYASDSHQGLFVLHERDDPLGDPAWTSFA